MSDKSGISWTDATWNPVTGCTKVSPGCAHCYAERVAERFRDVKGHAYERGFDLQLRPERLDQPVRWQRRRMIFVNSMSDLFHEDIPDDFIAQVFDVMWHRAPRHTYQVLTKRAERMRDFCRIYYGDQKPPMNIWLGVSVENQVMADRRIPFLLEAPAAVRFLSCEPLLGPLDLSRWIGPGLLTLEMSQQLEGFAKTRDGAMWNVPFGNVRHEFHGLAWAIVGGESGPRARPMDMDWARAIRDTCVPAMVPFFFKQVGGVTSKSGGDRLDRRQWRQMPLEFDELEGYMLPGWLMKAWDKKSKDGRLA